MKNMVTDFKDFNLGRETDLNIYDVKNNNKHIKITNNILYRIADR